MASAFLLSVCFAFFVVIVSGPLGMIIDRVCSVQYSKPYDESPGDHSPAAKLSLTVTCRGCNLEQTNSMKISWSLWIKPSVNDTGNALEKKVFNLEDWSEVRDLLSMSRAGIDSEFLILKANSLEGGRTYTAKATGRLRVRSFGMIQIKLNDPRLFGSCCVKGTEESTLGTNSWVPLMHHDPSDLGSLILIWIIPKERTLNLFLWISQ